MPAGPALFVGCIAGGLMEAAAADMECGLALALPGPSIVEPPSVVATEDGGHQPPQLMDLVGVANACSPLLSAAPPQWAELVGSTDVV